MESLQPLKSPHRYPAVEDRRRRDLVLFGTPANNVLLLDQMRGQIFPHRSRRTRRRRGEVLYTRSPFVGECDVLNIIASDARGHRRSGEGADVPPK